MSDNPSSAGGRPGRGLVDASAAEVYERDFVPALFGVWSAPLIDAAGVTSGDRVVDVGCGTGVLARAARQRTAPDGHVIGVDPNAGMLAVARRVDPTIEWRDGRAESLPIDDGWADAVVSQFALMFVDDLRAAGDEMARVLRPGGRLAVATWAAIGRNPGFDAMHRLLRELFGADVGDGLLAPFSIGHPADLAAALRPSFGNVVVSEASQSARFASIDAWVHTEIRGWTLSSAIDDEMYDAFLDEARRRWTRFVSSDGSVEFPSPALIATAMA